jgi:hypothetical protein
MRKLLIGSALTIMIATACNNGKYDAQPDVDYSAGLNHLTGDSTGAKVYLGSMEGVLNDKHTIFSPAFCYQDDQGIMTLVARIKDDTILRRTIYITYGQFEGKRIDTIDALTGDPVISLKMVDVGNFDIAGRQLYKYYTANTGENFGYATINIEGNEGGNLRGFFFGQLYKFLPEATESPKYDRNDVMDFELTNFYFKKVPFPLTGSYLKIIQG